MKMKRELIRKLYMQNEENILHISKDIEFSIYNAVASGNRAEITATLDRYSKLSEKESRTNGILSKDPLRNAKYHFVIFAAMASKTCMQKGLDLEISYSLSDLYIQKMDECTSISDVENLKLELAYEFAEHMKEINTNRVYSKHINKCINYIYSHLTTDITVTSIAAYLELSPTYLSKLFLKETGMKLTSYIKDERLKAAANMLRYSDYSIAELADHFCFASQSHFTNSFSKKYHITPKKYRDTADAGTNN